MDFNINMAFYIVRKNKIRHVRTILRHQARIQLLAKGVVVIMSCRRWHRLYVGVTTQVRCVKVTATCK